MPKFQFTILRSVSDDDFLQKLLTTESGFHKNISEIWANIQVTLKTSFSVCSGSGQKYVKR